MEIFFIPFFLYLHVRNSGLTIFWPQYFDKSRSVRMGRRVSQENATQKPTLDDLLKAATKAGYYVEADPKARYPRSWWDDPGYVMIDTTGQKKSFVLNKLAPIVSKVKNDRQNEAKLASLKKKKNKSQNKNKLLQEKIKQRKSKQTKQKSSHKKKK
jgi:signal recognition particle subunit SEC65